MGFSGGILNTGVSGLLAFQKSIATISHNITNVNTEGYTRQRVELSPLPAQSLNPGFIGSGVRADSIRRVYNEFLYNQVRTSTSANSYSQTYYSISANLDNLLGDSETGLASVLQGFYNAIQDVSNDPSSMAAREVMLSEASTLVDRFQYMNQFIADSRKEVNSRIEQEVTEINLLASSIAQLNEKISHTMAQGINNPPNDLLDQRDQLILKLSERVSITTVLQDDQSLNVFVGKGHELVQGASSGDLTVASNHYDGSQFEIAMEGGSTIITPFITGGSLGGLLDFRHDVLDETENALGRIAMGLAQTFNAQHRKGLDLNGELGDDFFTVPLPDVLPHVGNEVPLVNNEGSAYIQVTIEDAGSITTSDYRLSFEENNWTLSRLSDGTKVPMSGGTDGAPFVAEGLALVIEPGIAQDGDSFLIRPTRKASAKIDALFQDPAKIAAAGPLRVTESENNSGSASVTSIENVDPENSALFDDIVINFTDPITFTVNDETTPHTFNGKYIDIGNGWRLEITGTPKVGDQFTVSKNDGAVGDNRNSLLLAGLFNSKELLGGNAGYESAYGQMVAFVGNSTHQADINRHTRESLLNQAVDAKSEVSGVNLDEEAANLICYERAYQAAAQIIETSENLFQTLLNVVRR
ncbi:MAG: flagellar hook-associated protein FlgK [Thermodesulfobacteriota bacterium]|nr:flagellar hook-associated protein FlgK [Thermodesulfobacteriota bacterium]